MLILIQSGTCSRFLMSRNTPMAMTIAKDPNPSNYCSPWTFKLRTAPIAGAATRATLTEYPPRRRKVAADEIMMMVMVWGLLNSDKYVILLLGYGNRTTAGGQRKDPSSTMSFHS